MRGYRRKLIFPEAEQGSLIIPEAGNEKLVIPEVNVEAVLNCLHTDLPSEYIAGVKVLVRTLISNAQYLFVPGIPQSTATITFLLIDKSGSMGNLMRSLSGTADIMRIEAALKGALKFAGVRRSSLPDSYVTTFFYDDQIYGPSPAYRLDSHFHKVIEYLQKIFPSGATAIADSLMVTRIVTLIYKEIVKAGVDIEVIGLTDGHEVVRTDEEVYQAGISLRKVVSKLSIIGIGNDPSEVNEPVLRATASPDSYYFCSEFEKLLGVFENLGYTLPEA